MITDPGLIRTEPSRAVPSLDETAISSAAANGREADGPSWARVSWPASPRNRAKASYSEKNRLTMIISDVSCRIPVQAKRRATI
jgi:hypothetical protein